MGALVLEESVDEDGRRERRVANLDSVEDARAVAEHGEAAAMERALWGSSASSSGSGKESTAEADRARGLGGGAEWPRMPGMKPIKPVSPRRSPRKRSGGGNQQKQKQAQTADLFGSALQRSRRALELEVHPQARGVLYAAVKRIQKMAKRSGGERNLSTVDQAILKLGRKLLHELL